MDDQDGATGRQTEPFTSGQPGVEEEYVEHMQHIDDVAGKPLRIIQVTVQGLEKTKDTVVARELERLTQASTFQEVQRQVEDAYMAIDHLDIFDTINIEIDASETFPDTCSVNVKVHERRVFGVSAGTYLQGTKGSLEVTGSARNYFGYAENVELTLDGFKERYEVRDLNLSGLPGGTNLDLKVTVPRVAATDSDLEVGLHHKQHNLEKWSSYVEQRSGISISSVWGSTAEGQFRPSYDLSWLQLSRNRISPFQVGRTPSNGSSSQQPSNHVRQQMGSYLKSAAQLAYTKATFNDDFFPTAGFGFRSVSEVAGLWPDPKALRFGKQELQGEWLARLGSDNLVVALQGSAGLMVPWGRDYWERPTNISERFSAGGVEQGARGFFIKGIGSSDVRLSKPHEGGDDAEEGEGGGSRTHDYLGGDVQATLTAALRMRNIGIPVLDNNGIYAQAFVGCSNNMLASGQGRTAVQIRDRFLDTFRVSGGLSLVWPTQIAKFELGYARVRQSTTQPQDSWRNGIFFGATAKLW